MFMNGQEVNLLIIHINLMTRIVKVCQIKMLRVWFAVAAGTTRPGTAGSRTGTCTRPAPGSALSGSGFVFPRGQRFKRKGNKKKKQKRKDKTITHKEPISLI